MSLFVTGTDTGVGKTYTATQLLRLARASGLRSAGYKPVCCGDRHDAELLLAASDDGLTLDDVNPVWFHTPAAPLTASLVERRDIDLPLIHEQFEQLSTRFDVVVVEGVGGWLAPIRDDYFVSDLCAELQLPVLIVARNRLGCLNHTMLTIESVAARGLRCVGVAFNNPGPSSDAAETTNLDVLKRISSVPLLPGLTAEIAAFPPEWRQISDCRRYTNVSGE
ncbi:MAG TPA: dethiobiotin synthase [Chthoniobacterales bacterium]|nr:dethiobiotin synthase [Chthoniobacterales bacterium]